MREKVIDIVKKSACYSMSSLFAIVSLLGVFFAGYSLGRGQAVMPGGRESVDWTFDYSQDDPYLYSFPEDVNFDPATFKSDLQVLISAKKYSTAAALLDSVIIDVQIEHEQDSDQYFAIGGNSLQVPGANRNYIWLKDWEIPSDGESLLWFDRAYSFAKCYNTRLTDLKSKQAARETQR